MKRKNYSKYMSFDIEKKSIELELIFDSINKPIILIDKNFQIKRLNRASLDFLSSQNFAEFIDQKCFTKLYGRDKICPYCPFDSEKNSFDNAFIENREIHREILLKNETIRLSFFPIFQDNDFHSVVENISNLTSKLEKEEEKLKYRNLASLGVMISGVAHELNNPLTGIGFTVQNLLNNLQHITNDFLKNRLDMIQKDLERASNVVNDIISFAKPEKQKYYLTDINTIVHNSKEATQRLYPDLSKNIQWEIHNEYDDSFYFDPSKMERVFLNLFRNALQAFDYKKGQIRIDIKKKKNMVQLSIEDNAGGIDKQAIDKIFDPFYSNKKDSMGTGLGLSICFSIIADHQGKISVKSKDDRTKFQITLPLIKKL